MSRWVRVDVDLFAHEFFASSEPFSDREAWLWLIANAAWKDTVHRVGNEMVDVPAGSLFATLRGLQAAWHWKSDKRVRSFISRLENGRMVEAKTDAGKTHITICNYSYYQESGRKEDATRTQPGRSADALKTPVHQDTNTSSLRSDVPAPAPAKRGMRLPANFEPDIEFAVGLGLTRSQAEAESSKFRDYWTAKAGKDACKLDWPATWRNWCRNASAPRGSRPSQQGPPGMTPHQQRHRDAVKAIDRHLGQIPDEEFTGSTIDLADRDFRSH